MQLEVQQQILGKWDFAGFVYYQAFLIFNKLYSLVWSIDQWIISKWNRVTNGSVCRFYLKFNSPLGPQFISLSDWCGQKNKKVMWLAVCDGNAPNRPTRLVDPALQLLSSMSPRFQRAGTEGLCPFPASAKRLLILEYEQMIKTVQPSNEIWCE